MRVKLCFRDWISENESIYETHKGNQLTAGFLHSGTVINGTITLDEYDEYLLKQALKEKIYPVFEIIEEGD